MLSSRAKAMLNSLLDKQQAGDKGFEREKSDRPIRIYVRTDKVFKDYRGSDYFKYRDDFHDGVEELEKMGLVIPKYEPYTGRLISLELRQDEDHLERAFELTGHSRKKAIISERANLIREGLRSFGDVPLCQRYLERLQNLLSQNRPTNKEFSSREDLLLQLSMLKAIQENEEDILLRNFSKRHFADSKILERHASRILSLFNEFGEERFEDFDELMEEHHIFRFRGFTYLKNNIDFDLNGQSLSLNKLKVPFSLTEEAIDDIRITNISAKRVITVENQTTFIYFDDPEAVIIYLAGFHNQLKRNLLMKINEFNPNLEWFHYGDIDCGGFQIFQDLKAKTGLDFKPFRMGINELKKYKEECQPLTDQDRKRLESMRQDSNFKLFWDVIDWMLSENVKLEQESIE